MLRIPPAPVLLLAPLTLAAAGCVSHRAEVSTLVSTYETGGFEAAAAQLETKGFRDGLESDTNGVRFQLEAGKVLQDAGRFEESFAMFERASAGLERWDLEADVSLSEEALATVWTQTSRPYRGTAHDRILLEVYQTFNALALGDLDEALVRVRRAYRRQAEAVARNGEEIASRQQSDSAVAQEALQQPAYLALEAETRTLATEAYADFVNPVATFLQAVLLREEGSNPSALVELRKLIGIAPRNTYLPPLLEEFEASEAPVPGRYYVLFENGMAPERIEVALTFPTPNGWTRVALPKLQTHPTQVSALVVTAPATGEALVTEQLASVDSIVATDFAARLPGIVFRTMLSVAAKEGLSYAARSNDDTGLAWLATDLYRLLTSDADLRTWRTLGAEFQLAWGEAPRDGVLELALRTTAGEAGAVRVALPPARTTLVLVRNPRLAPIEPRVLSIGEAPRPAAPAPGPSPADPATLEATPEP
jgi:hypothetical protein